MVAVSCRCRRGLDPRSQQAHAVGHYSLYRGLVLARREQMDHKILETLVDYELT
jgi:hypothetical protein